MIKYILSTIVLIFCLSGCINNKKESYFTTIDYSYSDGWAKNYSLKINNIGDMVVMEEDHHNNKRYGFFRLSIPSFDSIHSLVCKIDFTQMDTLYSANCVDCGYYYLIIKNQEQVNKIFVENIDNNDQRIKSVSLLSNFLNTMLRDSVLFINDSFFESKTNSFQRIPPMDTSQVFIK